MSMCSHMQLILSRQAHAALGPTLHRQDQALDIHLIMLQPGHATHRPWLLLHSLLLPLQACCKASTTCAIVETMSEAAC